MEVYGRATIGVALADVLEQLLKEGIITEDEGTSVFEEFGRVIQLVFRDQLHRDAPMAQLCATVECYNHYIDEWKLVLNQVELILGGYKFPCPTTQVNLKLK